jgi:hypothetical protein
VRAALREGILERAQQAAAPLLALAESVPARQPEAVERFLAALADPAERALFSAQVKLFHTQVPSEPPASPAARRELLLRLYDRPLNLLGQVPNSGKDIGGTPAFIATRDGIEKVCIEVPHVSAADKQAYLADPARATHFNPVFVAAEITKDADYYAERNQEFWLLAEKTYRGQPVCYHETVLYELLSHGGIANALFVEVPRLVFHPHKSLQDAVNRSIRDWT